MKFLTKESRSIGGGRESRPPVSGFGSRARARARVGRHGLRQHRRVRRRRVPRLDRLPVRDGDRFAVGALQLGALATPGHTPEHVSYVAYEPGSETPHAVFTGGIIDNNAPQLYKDLNAAMPDAKLFGPDGYKLSTIFMLGGREAAAKGAEKDSVFALERLVLLIAHKGVIVERR